MANDILTQTASDLEHGVFVQATKNPAGVVRIMVTNLKYRDDRVTSLTIRIPSSVVGATITYHLIDASHSDYYDQGAGAGTLETVTAPAIVSGTVTLTMQPRSVHLLEFVPPSPPLGNPIITELMGSL